MKIKLLALLIGISSFSHIPSKPTFELYVFSFTGNPTVAAQLLATTTVSGKSVYQKWELTDVEFVTCAAGEERACKIAVSEEYVQIISATIYLNAADPDGGGSKLAFPMSIENGLFTGGLQYYKVSTSIETSSPTVIDVRNGTVN